ncbi:MAG: hypothetical protein IIC24_08825, partial [Chloroflexi bacterium]|nr:hypothetical protein [Chloroflexota bacterium]
MQRAVIVSGARTPIGRFGGAFKSFGAPDLGAVAIRAALERASLDPSLVEEVIMGNALQAQDAGYAARLAALRAGIPEEVPAITVNRICSSGLEAINLAAIMVLAGEVDIVVAGGTENMSMAPYLVRNVRWDGLHLGKSSLDDSVVETLSCPVNLYHMGVTAENVAGAYGVSREDQDAMALASHQRAIAAIENGSFDSQLADVSVPQRRGDPVVVARVPGLDSPVRIGLLIGSHTPRVKRDLQKMISTGEIDVIVGTHAVIQEAVQFRNLGLAVVDEQHRFGVEQRAALADQRPRPHLLGMSATPIPRSLALTLYGDLDLTTLRELPGGRKPITTLWARTPDQRSDAHRLVIDEVAAGRQAFVVCPLINESEEIRTRSAVEEFDYLAAGPFSALRLGLLHGRLPLAEKQQVMDLFRARKIDVLVATPVIEVGIDIPNATVMLIEGAERFGLSQLHQLRGRIGRGAHASRCILLSDDPSPDARERMGIIERVSDGFDLAEEDLRLRGPGDYVGTRQSGFADLRIATLLDADLLASARAEATDLIAA